MTKISRYVIDEKVTGSDKWIGSDAQTQYTTKNFTPTKLAVYFNENQIIDIGTPIRYKYDILEVGDARLPGTITFEPQVGTPYSISSISSFILSKYTLKGNDVTQYLNFLIGSNVLIYKADDINTFGLYKVVSLVENIAEPDFFDVVVSYTTGNGSILEDRDYLISLIDSGDIPTKTSDLINDGEDGVHPFITAADIPPSTIPTLQQVTDEGNITTNSITVDSVDYYSIIEPSVIGTENKNTGNYTYLGADGVVGIRTEGFDGLIKTTNLTETITLEFPEKTTGIYTIATIEDLSDYVPYEGATQNVDLGVYDITAAHLIKDGGTASQFLKADGTVDSATYLTSVGLSMPVAFNVANSPLTSDGTIAVSAAGTSSQYIRGDGQLATLPSSGGGGASVFYYLNGSIAASVATYKQLSNTAVIGTGTDFTLTGNGLITQFLTDAGNPNRLQIPSGAWNFEMFFSMSSSGGTPKFYVELLKYNGTTFTTIASSSAVPETINSGTSIDLYLTSLAVPETTLLLTDRLAIRVYIVNNSGGRTAKLHTENSHLCQIITTFASGIAALNGLTSNNQYLAVGTTGTDFNISSVSETHTFNLPTASATNRGALSSADWTTFNGKFNLPSLISGSVLFSNGTTIAQDNAQFFWDDTNNRLGIGTSTPGDKLEVNGNIFASGVNSIGTLTRYNSLGGVAMIGLSGNAYATIQAYSNAGGTGKSLAINPSGGNVGIGTTAPTAKLHIAAPGALSTDIALRVRNSADTADLMVVNGLGNVGIGTSSPSSKLDVTSTSAGAIVNNITVQNLSGTIGTEAGIFFAPTASTSNSRGARITAIQEDGNNNIGLKFYTGSGATITEKMRILADGRLGIGTTAPTAKLHITAPGALSTDIALRVRNSADTVDVILLRGDGNIQANGIKNASGNFYVDAGPSGDIFIRPGTSGYNRYSYFRSNGNVELAQFGGNVLIGTSTDLPSSKLTIESTTQGFLPPRMTTTQKNAIATPVSGLVVYDTTLGKLCVRGAAAWETITSI